MENVANFRSQPHSKSGGLFSALDRRYGVAGIVQPQFSRWEHYCNELRNFYPNREHWRRRANINAWAFTRRTELAEQALRSWEGRYDLIMQLHTLMSPGTRLNERPYVLHTDNSYMLSERYYPLWAPITGRKDRDTWVERERQTYRNAAYLFPRSEWLRRSLIDDYGCDPERVIRVGGGANFALKSLEHKRYDTQIALFVGSEFSRKGGHVLLQAWEKVHRKLPNAQLWILGAKAQGKHTSNGIRWHGWVADRKAVADMYAQATVFVMPSLFEPWGHAFFEAMGNGLPCIGTNHCAMPEIVEHGVTGLLVPPHEPAPLADSLIALLGDEQRACAMGHAAHAYVSRGCTWDDVVSRMAPFIDRILGVETVAAI